MYCNSYSIPNSCGACCLRASCRRISLQIYKEETSLPAMSSYYVVDQEDDEVQHVGFPLCPY